MHQDIVESRRRYNVHRATVAAGIVADHIIGGPTGPSVAGRYAGELMAADSRTRQRALMAALDVLRVARPGEVVGLTVDDMEEHVREAGR